MPMFSSFGSMFRLQRLSRVIGRFPASFGKSQAFGINPAQFVDPHLEQGDRADGKRYLPRRPVGFGRIDIPLVKAPLDPKAVTSKIQVSHLKLENLARSH